MLDVAFEVGRLLTWVLGPHLSEHTQRLIGIIVITLILLTIALFWIWEIFGPPAKIPRKGCEPEDEETPQDHIE